jgi:hypothetical protein
MQPPRDHVFVRTTESKAAAAARIGAGLGQQKRAELVGLLRVRFARVEPWVQARKYVGAVVSELASWRNGWTIAEQVGDRTPDRTQHERSARRWPPGVGALDHDAAGDGGPGRGSIMVGVRRAASMRTHVFRGHQPVSF